MHNRSESFYGLKGQFLFSLKIVNNFNGQPIRIVKYQERFKKGILS